MSDPSTSRTSYSVTSLLIEKVNLFFLKYKSAVAILFILALAGQVAIQYMLFNLKSDATLINIAGRQRMLGQEIIKNLIINSANEEDQIKISQLKHEWHSSLQDIRYSDNLGDLSFKNNDHQFIVLHKAAENFQKKVLDWNPKEQTITKLLEYDEGVQIYE